MLLNPTQAAAAEAFLEQHLRMDDVRRYLLDVLRLYAALQTFKVKVPAAS
jgi:Glycosyl transferase family 90